MEIQSDLVEWFVARVNYNPEVMARWLMDNLEKSTLRAHTELHRVIRESSDLSEIRKAQGRLDGIQEVVGFMGGLRMSEAKKPTDRGLADRILGLGRK